MNGEQRFYLAVGLAVMIAVALVLSIPLSIVAWMILSEFMSVSVPLIFAISGIVSVVGFLTYIFVGGLRA